MTIPWGLLPGALRQELDGVKDEVRGARRSPRDIAVDAGLVAVALGIGWLAAGGRTTGGITGPELADYVLGVLGCAALLVRRRLPVSLALVTTLLSAFSPAIAGAAFVATFSVAVHRELTIAVWVGVLGVATGMVNVALYHDDYASYGVSFVGSFLFTAAAVGWGGAVRARRQLLISLAERARQAEAEQRERALEARRLERSRLAREMHDVLAHRMSLLSVHAGALEFRPNASEEEIARAAGVIRSGAHQMLMDLREVIGILREEPSEETGPPQASLTAIDQLLDEVRSTGTQLTVDMDIPDLDAVPTLVGRTAYRIIQEGLTNARKHAPGMPVTATVTGAPTVGLSVEVRQRLSRDSATPDPIPGGGVGLIGLAERATLAGGRLEHGPTDGGEYLLRAWLPWER